MAKKWIAVCMAAMLLAGCTDPTESGSDSPAPTEQSVTEQTTDAAVQTAEPELPIVTAATKKTDQTETTPEATVKQTGGTEEPASTEPRNDATKERVTVTRETAETVTKPTLSMVVTTSHTTARTTAQTEPSDSGTSFPYVIELPEIEF